MNRLLNIILAFGLLLIQMSLFSQVVLERQVIGSTGGYQVGSTMSLSSTVGEANIQSLFSVNQILTQGFQQPNLNNSDPVDFEVINEQCNGSQNGSIFINDVLGCTGPYTIFVKSVLDTTVLLDETKLSAGDYRVRIVGASGCFFIKIITVGLDSEEDCKLKFYSGITPNGDGNNDIWSIDNIEQFPENDVKIFNRWGDIVWEGSEYNNDDVVWDGKNSGGNDLPDGTYFYLATVDGETYKGWVEITR